MKVFTWNVLNKGFAYILPIFLKCSKQNNGDLLQRAFEIILDLKYQSSFNQGKNFILCFIGSFIAYGWLILWLIYKNLTWFSLLDTKTVTKLLQNSWNFWMQSESSLVAASYRERENCHWRKNISVTIVCYYCIFRIISRSAILLFAFTKP